MQIRRISHTGAGSAAACGAGARTAAAGAARRYGISIEPLMRQQFAGPLDSSAAMQMPALPFSAYCDARAGAGRRGRRGRRRLQLGAPTHRMFRCRRRKLRALRKS